MKNHSLILLLFVIVFASCMVSCNTENVSAFKQLNNKIDQEISDIVSIFRDPKTTIDDVYESEEKISNLELDILRLQANLEGFNSRNNNILFYNSKLFDLYLEDVSDLREWKEILIDFFSGSMSGLEQAFRTSYGSIQATAINSRKEVIDSYKPKYD